MPLTRQDALRLLRFCLGPDDSGSIEVADDGAALVTIAPAEPSIGVRTFEASTFDAALRMAVDAGLLKAACVEKQILFLEGGAARGPDASAAAPPRRPRPDLFPKLIATMSGLLHETQNERGMSAIAAASSGRIFRRELPRQRERMDARRERFLSLWREMGDTLGASLAGRFDRVDGCLRQLVAGRGSDRRWPDGAAEVIASTRARTPSCWASVTPRWSRTRPRTIVPTRWPASCCCTRRRRPASSARASAPGWPRRSISDDDRRALAALTSARTSYLHVFAATAPRPAEQLLERALASASYARADADGGAAARRPRDARSTSTRAAGSTSVSREMDHLGEIGTAALGFVGDV